MTKEEIVSQAEAENVILTGNIEEYLTMMYNNLERKKKNLEYSEKRYLSEKNKLNKKRLLQFCGFFWMIRNKSKKLTYFINKLLV